MDGRGFQVVPTDPGLEAILLDGKPQIVNEDTLVDPLVRGEPTPTDLEPVLRVRSNFRDTWIWLEMKTWYLVHILMATNAYKSAYKCCKCHLKQNATIARYMYYGYLQLENCSFQIILLFTDTIIALNHYYYFFDIFLHICCTGLNRKQGQHIKAWHYKCMHYTRFKRLIFLFNLILLLK